MMDCIHPARPDWLRITDPSEARNCPDFSTIGYRPKTRVRPRKLTRTILIVGGLAVALVGGGMSLLRGARTGLATPLHATVSVPSEVSADTSLSVKVLVRNEGKQAADGVEVTVGGKSMRNLVWQAVEPPEAFSQATPLAAIAYLGTIQPGDIGSVTFYFSPHKPGEIKLTAQVTAANMGSAEQILIETEILP